MDDLKNHPLLPALDNSLKGRLKRKIEQWTDTIKKAFRPQYPSVFGPHEDIYHLSNSDDNPQPTPTRRSRLGRFFS